MWSSTTIWTELPSASRTSAATFVPGLMLRRRLNFSPCDKLPGKIFNRRAVCLKGKLRGNAFGFREKDRAHIAIVNGGQRLRGGPGQPDAVAQIQD